MTANPAQAFKILKKMGAPPGQLESATTFTLDSHENLTVEQAAENIAKHFSKISQEFDPLNIDHLPERVQDKLKSPESESKVPFLSTFEVYKTIMAAKKPKSGVPSDLPSKIMAEFAPEIATPAT